MFLLKFHSLIPPPIVVALLLLLSPLTACGGQYGGKSTVAELTLTVTVTNQTTEKFLRGAQVIAQLTYSPNCGNLMCSCEKHIELREALSINNQGQVEIPLLSQKISDLPMPTEVKVICMKSGYKTGTQTINSYNGATVNCSMEPDNMNYQGIGKINVVDKTTQQPISNPQFKFEQSGMTIPNGIWDAYAYPTKITVSADNYHPKTVMVQPDKWPVKVELEKLVYKYSLTIKLYNHEGKEIKGQLPKTAKVSIKFNGKEITPQYANRFPLTVPIQESKTRSNEEQFSIHIDYPPYKETVVTLDLANSLWDYDRYSPGVLKATYHLTFEKPKKALVVLVNQANAWKGKPYGTWKKSLRIVFNPWWKTQQKFSYFGYGRIAAGVYPRLIHQSEDKAPASLIMGERMFNAFVEPHLLADFFLEENDDAIWSKLLDADDQPKADEWFFIILLPHNTLSLVSATVERYQAYAGEGSWQNKRAQLNASLEKYNANLYIIEDFFKPAEEVECDVAESTAVADSKPDDETTAVDDVVAESINKGDSSGTVETTANETEPQTQEDCVPQSTERSIIEALSDLDRISYQAIPYGTFNQSVPKTILNGLLQKIEKDVE